jgi:hypothetical protein
VTAAKIELMKSKTAGDVSAAGRLFDGLCQSYLMLLRLVANDSLAMKVAPHQLEPGRFG